jgi:hypothetical protein
VVERSASENNKEIEMEAQVQHKHEAHVTLGIDDQPPVKKVVPAGDTKVRALKEELGVDAKAVLYLVHGSHRRVLDDSETLDVKSGMHFEAIGGGKAS